MAQTGAGRVDDAAPGVSSPQRLAMKDGPEIHLTTYLADRTTLINHAARIVGSRDVAEDVVQEAYLRFAPERSHLAVRERPSAYLFRIVHNLALDVLRRRRLETRQRSGIAPDWLAPQPIATPEESVLLCERYARAAAIVADLPQRQRIALEMRRHGGYAMPEVAAHLGVSLQTAYRLVQTALATITARLEPEAADAEGAARQGKRDAWP